MNQDAERLQTVLEQIEDGVSFDDAALRLGADGDGLLELAALAQLVRQRRPRPSSAWRARIQAELVEGVTTERRLPRLRPVMLRFAAAMTAVVLALGSLVVASADSQPGDLLYPVRRVVDDMSSGAVRMIESVRSVPPAATAEGRDTDSSLVPIPPRSEPISIPRSTTQRRLPTAGLERDQALPSGSVATDGVVNDVVARVPHGADRSQTSESSTGGDQSALPVSAASSLESSEGTKNLSGDEGVRHPPPADEVDAPLAGATVSIVEPSRGAPTVAAAPPTERPTDRPAPTPTPTPIDLPMMPGGPIEVQPGTEGAISGVVTYLDGSPLPRMTVSVYAVDWHRDNRGRHPWRPEPRWSSRVSVVTDDGGHYKIVGVAAGPYYVAAGDIHPFATRRWWRDTREWRMAELVWVRMSHETQGIDLRTRLTPWTQWLDRP